MIVVVFVLVAVVLLAVVLIIVGRRMSRPRDGVEQFQRQIDALSSEARRPVVDQVQAIEDDERDGVDDDHEEDDDEGTAKGPA